MVWCYIAHNGQRLSGSNATSNNLAGAFDIRIMTSNDSFVDFGSNYSTSSNWSNGSTGSRMDRSVKGDFTVGGRGQNRSFHGDVASMLVTTLRTGTALPSDAEIKKMITDPVGWLDDYKIEKFIDNLTIRSQPVILVWGTCMLNGQLRFG